MANKKISELPAAGALTGTEAVEALQGGVNVQTTSQAIANLAPGGGGSAWTTSAAGLVERSTQAESQAIITQFLAAGTTGLSGARTGSELEILDVLNALGIFPQVKTVTASAGGGASGTATINLDNIRWAKYIANTTWTGNITLALTNAGSSDEFEMMELLFLVTGTIRITFDSNVRMPDGTSGWNYAGKYIDVVSGGTGVLYRMTFTKAGSTIAVGISTAITI